jgi:hypothetical protein
VSRKPLNEKKPPDSTLPTIQTAKRLDSDVVGRKEGDMAAWEGVLLDADGTLVDGNDAHAPAWVEALAEAREKVQ